MSQINLLENIEVMSRKETCRSCKHRQRWRCGNSIIQYCAINGSNRTHNGRLKIKATMTACNRYEENK